MKKTIIIIGSDGQDGKILKSKLTRLKHNIICINKKNFDICDYNDVVKLVKTKKPNEIYFFAAYHGSSQKKINITSSELKKNSDINYIAPTIFINIISRISPKCKFFFASSCLIFKKSNRIQNEQTLIEPSEIYGFTKSETMKICDYYRKYKKIFINVGILYNHESIYRKKDFLSSKIVINAVKNYYGSNKKLIIGDLNAKVDWGSAYDYVDAIIALQKLKKSSNFVIATGRTYKVKDFVKIAYNYLGLDYKKFVIEDNNIIFRNTSYRCGNPYKLKKNTGWEPKKSFELMIKEMVDYHLKKNEK